MSYVKHTWVNNEVISASKMNNIEEGIEEASQSGGSSASVQVNVMSNGSITIEMGLVDMTTGPSSSQGELFGTSLSILGGGYYPKYILSVPLPDKEGTIQNAIILSDYIVANFIVTTTGGVAPAVPVFIRDNASAFNSQGYYACIVTGDGTITLTLT